MHNLVGVGNDVTLNYQYLRNKATLEHHIKDYRNNVNIYDPNPLDEWENISLKTDNPKWLKNIYAKNADGSLNFEWMAEDGKIHYHVWIEKEFEILAKYLNLSIEMNLDFFPNRYDSFLIIFRK